MYYQILKLLEIKFKMDYFKCCNFYYIKILCFWLYYTNYINLNTRKHNMRTFT